MKPKVKPVTAWVIVGGKTILHSTVGGSRKLCIKDFCLECFGTWDNWEKLGYRCIKVNITPVEEEGS